MVLAFVALVALANGILSGIGGWFGYPELSFQMILGWLFQPIMFMLNVTWHEADVAGRPGGRPVVLVEAGAELVERPGHRRLGADEAVPRLLEDLQVVGRPLLDPVLHGALRADRRDTALHRRKRTLPCKGCVRIGRCRAVRHCDGHRAGSVGVDEIVLRDGPRRRRAR